MAIDFSLSEEQLILQRTAREFAENEVKPLAVELDKNPDPSKSRFPIDLYQKAAKLGFTNMLLPAQYGGPGLGYVDMSIVLEEFGAADVGFAAVINAINFNTRGIMLLGTDEQRKWWLDLNDAEGGTVMWAGGLIEPDAGGCEFLCTIPDAKLGIKTVARRQGEEYIINGSKSAFCTNAGDAKYFSIYARTDMTKPQTEGTSIFIIPAGTPGLTVGKLTNKIGWRCVSHAELSFDNLQVPRKWMLGGEGTALKNIGAMITNSAIGQGAFSVGLARAAFEYATDYAKQRVTWGKPIIKHQAIATMLADMQIEIEAARALVWLAAWNNDTHEPSFINTRSCMQRVFATEMAVKVTQMAANILGGYGLTTEFPLEKYMRDALVGTIAGFTNAMHRLYIADTLGGSNSGI